MKIYYDENMPFAREFFSEFGETQAFSGRDVSAEILADADVLLVRSITQVNEQLLKQNKNLKFVGSATIGFDHIDRDYLSSRGIYFTSAPGCNAVSVAEYVISALVTLAEKDQFSLVDKTVGIVGAGNTGSRLSEKLTALGVAHKLCDPLLEAQGDPRKFSSLDDVLSCDVVSLHVPKTLTGEHATFHLLNEERLARLTNEQILINACRGEVIDNNALLAIKQAGAGFRLALDVWENEPNILLPLIDNADIATAHIAGYSLEGKARGSEMLYQALCKQLAKPITQSLNDYLPQPMFNSVEINHPMSEILLNPLVKMVYDVRRDDAIFRQQINSCGFDHIRKTYPARREFSSLLLTTSLDTKYEPLYQLGFSKNVQQEEK
ncbi:4-phosphoerythronate dehydrogenase [Thalassotalea eurytherma]|uniref:Erythronate-4-phosphate dehydrogenase n=1 Tax=Thalassotalea eurytherma TaxID=1144278 RepID=A0ABQ6H3F6_9GAMM|nr:4-phosphoerythronate dehydrogenase [Thalassotalea eurytherma]GLX82632.1 erythronate-4-phosphate dehydrogenase [Thalassotalea eurytherma]